MPNYLPSARSGKAVYRAQGALEEAKVDASAQPTALDHARHAVYVEGMRAREQNGGRLGKRVCVADCAARFAIHKLVWVTAMHARQALLFVCVREARV